MGFDISFHPISKLQIQEWYFNGLDTLKKEGPAALEAKVRSESTDAHLCATYLDTLKVAAGTEPGETFEQSHAYYMAVIQGLFHKYYYTRGSAVSFLIEEHPELKSYITPWEAIKPASITSPVTNLLTANYSGGVYLDEENVRQLMKDLSGNQALKQIFTDFFGLYYPVFIKALQDACENHLGLLEASEVIEPNPLDLNKSTCYSYLKNCDPEGALIYQQIAIEQIKSIKSD